MATPVVQDPQTFLATSSLEPQGPTPCTREQVSPFIGPFWFCVMFLDPCRSSLQGMLEHFFF